MKKFLKTNKPNQFIKVEVSYEKGGMNYASGRPNRRGYYVYVTPVERHTDKDGITMESYILFSGCKQLINEVGRKSDKQYQAAVLKMDEVAKPLIESVLKQENLELVQDE